MKFSLFSLIFLTLACGEYKVTGGASETVGELKPRSMLITNADRRNVSSICDALSVKEQILENSINTPLSFVTTQKNCLGEVSDTRVVEVNIQSSGSNFVFRRTDNQDFIFPVIETTSAGVLSEICRNRANLTSPIGGSQPTYFTTVGVPTESCAPVAGEVCIQVERASPQGDFNQVHTKEWLRVRVSSPNNEKIGFVTERKKITKSFCGDNQVLVFESRLQ